MKSIFYKLLICVIIVSGCSKVPLTNRKQFTALPESELIAMALTEYNSFLSANQVVTNTSEANMVSTVGSRLATATETFLKENKLGDRVNNFKWEYNLVKADEINAWCMPGGKIVVYTGILPVTKTETGLAVVMGHEIAHAVARHGNERMSQMLAQQLGGVALSVALSTKPQQTRDLFMTAYGIGTTVGVLLPYSRHQESEADKLGLIFMAVAGYNPSEAPEFWKRMAAAGGAAPPEFLSTHPSNERRIRDINNYLPKAMKYYKPS